MNWGAKGGECRVWIAEGLAADMFFGLDVTPKLKKSVQHWDQLGWVYNPNVKPDANSLTSLRLGLTVKLEG